MANASGHSEQPHPTAQPVGRFHAWWRGDTLPALPPVPGLSIAATADTRLLSELSGTDQRELDARMACGHTPWSARIDGEPVGWGWCATREVSIGELGIAVPLPPGNRYLWDFFTVPTWRGRGVYPWLLQTIIEHEPEAARFWVGHDLGNLASARGITKAGFHEVGLLYHRQDGGFELVPSGPLERAAAASDLFAVPIAGHLPARSA